MEHEHGSQPGPVRAGHLPLVLRQGPLPGSGRRLGRDAFGFWKANTHRLVGWHVKDGTRLASQPPPPANPFTQGSCVRGSLPAGLTNTDALIRRRRNNLERVSFRPGSGRVGYKKIFDEVGAKGCEVSILETDGGMEPRPTRAGRSGTRSSAISICSGSVQGRAHAPRRASRKRQCSRVTSSSPVRGLLAAFAVALVAAGGVCSRRSLDPHARVGSLYPAVARRPSQSLELS